MVNLNHSPKQTTVGIDTIELSIPLNRKLLLNDFVFGGSYQHKEQRDKESQGVGYQEDITIYWEKNLRQYYLPEVHFVDYPSPSGGRCYEYQIRNLSLPKLMYGNNISEIPAGDFEKVLEQLYTKLVFLELPVEITKEDLRNAKVSRVDYGKNFLFSDGTSMRLLGTMLDNAPLKKRSKKAKTQYYSGELFRDSIKSRAFIIYDKLAEFRASKSKSRPAYGKNSLGFNPDNVNPNKKLIRLEVQIQKTKQLKLELERLGFPKDEVSFEHIFSVDIASAVLRHYWSQVKEAICQSASVESVNGVEVMLRFAQIAKDRAGGPVTRSES